MVSLSSCESELHAVISTLSDGIFLRRCLEFVFNAEVEHVMFTKTGDEARYRESDTFLNSYGWLAQERVGRRFLPLSLVAVPLLEAVAPGVLLAAFVIPYWAVAYIEHLLLHDLGGMEWLAAVSGSSSSVGDEVWRLGNN